jgi:uncharacterized membrane protein
MKKHQLDNIASAEAYKPLARYQLLDLARGLSIILMLIYHACFGLKQLGIIEASFSTSLFWLSFRALIVFLFLGLVGIGLVMATRKKLVLRSYFRRLLLLLIYMSLISWLSFQVLPKQYVYFGILHLIFVSSILGLLFIRFYWFNLFAALTILIIANVFNSSFFEHPYLQWIGLMPTKPTSNDYAPLLPWFSFVLIGIFLGRFMLTNQWLQTQLRWQSKNWVAQIICWAGRYSLHIYFIHFQMFYILVYITS